MRACGHGQRQRRWLLSNEAIDEDLEEDTDEGDADDEISHRRCDLEQREVTSEDLKAVELRRGRRWVVR